MTKHASLFLFLSLLLATISALWMTGTLMPEPSSPLVGFFPFFFYVVGIICAFILYGETFGKTPAGKHLTWLARNPTVKIGVFPVSIFVMAGSFLPVVPSVIEFVQSHSAYSYPLLLLIPIVGLAFNWLYVTFNTEPTL